MRPYCKVLLKIVYLTLSYKKAGLKLVSETT